MNKKKLLIIISSVTIALMVTVAGIYLYPKFSNMNSEYATASAIQKIRQHIEKTGEWPKSLSDLNLDKSNEMHVYINYDVTTDEILENPLLLKESIRPQSGKFYTYPHYKQGLDTILQTIKDLKEVG